MHLIPGHPETNPTSYPHLTKPEKPQLNPITRTIPSHNSQISNKSTKHTSTPPNNKKISQSPNKVSGLTPNTIKTKYDRTQSHSHVQKKILKKAPPKIGLPRN